MTGERSLDKTEQESFLVRIAGVTLLVRPACPGLRPYFRDFETEEGEPAFTAASVPERLRRLEKSIRQAGDPLPSPRQMELLGLHESITEGLLARDILLMHGSALAVDGRACIFSAPSGTGKSTHARLVRELLGDRVLMINDDKPYLRFDPEEIMVCGSPWMGKHRLGAPVERPLTGLVFLTRGKTDSIRPLEPREELPLLLTQLYRPREAELMQRSLVLIDRLVREIPMYRMACTMEPDAPRLSMETLFGPGTCPS